MVFDVSLIALLIDCGADVNALDNEGCAPLHYAAIDGRSGVVAMLLKKNPDAGLRDHQGKTAEDYARAYCHEEVAGMIKNYERKLRDARLKELHRRNIEKLNRILRRPRHGG